MSIVLALFLIVTFQIAGAEHIPPKLVCPPEVMARADPGKSTASVSFMVYASDNSGFVNVSNSHTSQVLTGTGRFSGEFTVGVTEVTFEARDLSNNKAQCVVLVITRGMQAQLLAPICLLIIFIHRQGDSSCLMFQSWHWTFLKYD